MVRARPCLAAICAAAAVVALSGCANTPQITGAASGLTTASTAPMSYEGLAKLGKQWEAQPGDVNLGFAYANGLESIGQTAEQIEVYRKLAAQNPGDSRILGVYGRKLAAVGRTADAVPVLETAAQSPDADWRILSALGSVYDEQGQYAKARSLYQRVLAGDPNNLTVLNNLGMSFAMEGNLKQAEATLRSADALPDSKSNPRVRQNLALVVGLQGRFDEAGTLAKDDLPPDQVEANMAYLRKMLSQPNTWQQISEGARG